MFLACFCNAALYSFVSSVHRGEHWRTLPVSEVNRSLVLFEEALTSKICESYIFDLWWLWIVTISHGRLTRKNPSLTAKKKRRTQRGPTAAWQKFPFCLIFSFWFRYIFLFVSQTSYFARFQDWHFWSFFFSFDC